MTRRQIVHALWQDARQWWYHAELRQQGRAREAHRRERDSVRSSLDALDNATGDYWDHDYGRGFETAPRCHVQSRLTYGGGSLSQINCTSGLWQAFLATRATS